MRGCWPGQAGRQAGEGRCADGRQGRTGNWLPATCAGAPNLHRRCLPCFPTCPAHPSAALQVGHGYIAAGGQCSQLDVRLLATGEVVYKGHCGGSVNNALCIAPDASGALRLFVCNNDDTVKIFTLASGNLHTLVRREAPFAPCPMCQSAHLSLWVAVPVPARWRWRGALAACCRVQQAAAAWRTEEKETAPRSLSMRLPLLLPPPLLQVRCPVAINYCALSPGGKHLVCVGDNRHAYMYQAAPAGYRQCRVFTEACDAGKPMQQVAAEPASRAVLAGPFDEGAPPQRGPSFPFCPLAMLLPLHLIVFPSGRCTPSLAPQACAAPGPPAAASLRRPARMA